MSLNIIPWIALVSTLIMLGSELLTHSDQSHKVVMVEICDNALDDDGDLLIDLNDPDCNCDLIEPKSLIPNPSFEDMNCCPMRDSELKCSDIWIQASRPTTDYLHTCGWMGWTDFPPPLPFPDGDGVVGFRDGRVLNAMKDPNWKEYVGSCLLSPLKANIPYRLQFHLGFVNQVKSPAINISLFGTTDCDNIPFGDGDDLFGCPTNGPGWVKLGAKWSSTLTINNWVTTFIDVTPTQDIHAIALGPDCPTIESSINLYYFVDNLILADLSSFDYQIEEDDHPCSPDFTISIKANDAHNYQWYKEGIAIIGETDHGLSQSYGEGLYQLKTVDPNGLCNVTKAYDYRIPVLHTNTSVDICRGAQHTFGSQLISESGIYIDTFQSVHGCDSIVVLDLAIQEEVEGAADIKIFEGEAYDIGMESFKTPGDYEVNLLSALGCDSMVALSISYFDVYFPTVFSPNGDGQNDYFYLSGNHDMEEVMELKVFNRWGSVVFQQSNDGKSQNIQWDGQSQGRTVDPGIYSYLVRIRMSDGEIRDIGRSVLVIR